MNSVKIGAFPRLIRLGVPLLVLVIIALAIDLLLGVYALPPLRVSFSQSTNEVEVYDFLEFTAAISPPHPQNPFTDASIDGTFQTADGRKRCKVDGFCDSEDGSLYRIRFMPATPGDYVYAIEYRQGGFKRVSGGTFHVKSSARRGPIRIDPNNRWHFIWEGSGEHYFFNGTTAYWLMGWRDDKVIESSIERLHRLKINRLRVTVAGRTAVFYGEPVLPGDNWTAFVKPWRTDARLHSVHLLGRLGERMNINLGRDWFDSLANLEVENDIYHPGFDYSRFEVSYWQKFERALRFARDRDLIFSLVLDMNDSRVHPAPRSSDEYRFIRYAIARFGAFSNITWDLGDDLDRYRDTSWTHDTGALLKQWDPYHHLATSHPIDNAHQDRASEWFDFTSFQDWSRTQHDFMLSQRKQQERLGRVIPQTNEEYGYEDHYPMWAKGPGSDSADTLRRMAWEIVMSGGYQTAGETARRGTNIWPDTGGGWMNGRGDDTMTMLKGYGRMIDFFTSFEWWRTEPHDEFVDKGNYCLARPGEIYVAYLPHGGSINMQVQHGQYDGIWLNAATGEKMVMPSINVTGSFWNSSIAAGGDDWAIVLLKK